MSCLCFRACINDLCYIAKSVVFTTPVLLKTKNSPHILLSCTFTEVPILPLQNATLFADPALKSFSYTLEGAFPAQTSFYLLWRARSGLRGLVHIL